MSNPRHEQWNNIAIGIGAVCLLLIAVSEAIGFATPSMRHVLVGGVFVSGTIMWIVQSRKNCPHCGKKFGLTLRLLRPYDCKKCGRDIREGAD